MSPVPHPYNTLCCRGLSPSPLCSSSPHCIHLELISFLFLARQHFFNFLLQFRALSSDNVEIFFLTGEYAVFILAARCCCKVFGLSLRGGVFALLVSLWNGFQSLLGILVPASQRAFPQRLVWPQMLRVADDTLGSCTKKVNTSTLLRLWATSLSQNNYNTGNATVFGVSVAIWIQSKCACSLTVLEPPSFQVPSALAKFNEYKDYWKRNNIIDSKKYAGTKVS